MRKFWAALLCCLFALCFLSGCGSQISFTWMVDKVPANLDPQLAIDGSELVAVTNLYSGLVRLDETGTPQPECAESWEISADGRTYTFQLKAGLSYEKLKHHDAEYTLTADDFVFAFQRIFDRETQSPYTVAFSALENSSDVLAGSLSADSLGVKAPDPSTVVFALERADPQFLKKLALPGAMPCNREFFEKTRGAYGLPARGSVWVNVLANGPFRLSNWNENGLFLRRPSSGNLVSNLRIVLNATGEPAASGAKPTPPLTGAALLAGSSASAALSNEFEHSPYTAIPYTADTWSLVFNCSHPLLSQPQLRKALAAAALELDCSGEGRMPAQGLVPPAVTAGDASYRELAGSQMPHFSDPVELCRAGLEAAGVTRFSDISIILPKGSNSRAQAEALNQKWQKQLAPFSAFFSIKELPADEFGRRIRSGDYQIALLPLTPTSDSAPEALLSVSIANPTGGRTLQLLDELKSAGNWSAEQLAAAERTILEEAVVVPLWYQSRSLLVQPDVSDLIFRPFGPVLDLTWTQASK